MNIEDILKIENAAKNVNNELWKVITALHDLERYADLKEILISASGDLCDEVLRPLENHLEINQAANEPSPD